MKRRHQQMNVSCAQYCSLWQFNIIAKDTPPLPLILAILGSAVSEIILLVPVSASVLKANCK